MSRHWRSPRSPRADVWARAAIDAAAALALVMVGLFGTWAVIDVVAGSTSLLDLLFGG